jgi:hypothetical protein
MKRFFMPNKIVNATFEVLTDKVGVPLGTYEGHLEYLVVRLQGHLKESLAKAVIFVSEERLLEAGQTISNKKSGKRNVTVFLKSGDVKCNQTV